MNNWFPENIPTGHPPIAIQMDFKRANNDFNYYSDQMKNWRLLDGFFIGSYSPQYSGIFNSFSFIDLDKTEKSKAYQFLSHQDFIHMGCFDYAKKAIRDDGVTYLQIPQTGFAPFFKFNF